MSCLLKIWKQSLDAPSPARHLLRRCLQARPAAYLSAVVTMAFIVRLVLAVASVSTVAANTFDHNRFGWEMSWTARSIYLGQGFSSPFFPLTGPTALVPPLYPYLLAGFFHLFGLYTPAAALAILSFNSLCSALTCIPLYFLASNGLASRTARIAALVWAVYPFSIYFSANRVWDYALTTFIFVCCLAVAQKLHLRGVPGWVGFGLLYGIGVHSNPCIFTLMPFLLLIALNKMRRMGHHWTSVIGRPLIASITFLIVCAPWFIRDARVMHSRFLIRDGFWLEFYAGNNGDTSEPNSSFVHPASNVAEMRRYEEVGETAYLAEKHRIATDFAIHHKAFIAVASARRFLCFWTGFWSFSSGYLHFEPFDIPNVPFTIVLTFLMLRGLRRWRQENDEAALPYLLALLIFPIPYYLTHSSPEYRQPVEPVVVILVAVGLFGTGADRIQDDDASHLEADSQSHVLMPTMVYQRVSAATSVPIRRSARIPLTDGTESRGL